MRLKAFAGIILFFFIALVLGLFYTQVASYNLYKGLSEKNRIRVMPLPAGRGKIYDRKGSLLVTNRIAFDVTVIFQEIENEENLAIILSGILGIDKKKISQRIEERSRKSPFVPVVIAEDIEKEKAIRLEEMRQDLPGVIVTTRPLRSYLYKDAISHVTGYLGKISEHELKRYKTYGYNTRDFVGKDGVERSYNEYLRGTDGGLQTEVDAKGRRLRVLAVKEPKQGKNLYLSIDIKLQQFCDSLFIEKTGAIVVMDPATGAILALVSHPAFDPNAFVKSNNSGEVLSFLRDNRTFPMLNRAISGTYPLGSVFKIVVTVAALETALFDDKKTFFCNGDYRVGNRVFHCWNEKGHRTQTIAEGIKNSCNVFFYQLGLLVGVDEISKYSFKLGLGVPTGVDLSGEASGLVPTQSWKKRELKRPWFKGETANYAIGQGYLLVTPIQTVRMVAAVANGGKLVEPFLVDKIEDASTTAKKKSRVNLHHKGGREIRLKEKTIKTLREGLRDVVNARGGTGFYARSKDVLIAGKTGTAQNTRGESHAWFAGFAPAEDPKICVVVFAEHGGKGGLDPARFAKGIIEEAKRLELL